MNASCTHHTLWRSDALGLYLMTNSNLNLFITEMNILHRLQAIYISARFFVSFDFSRFSVCVWFFFFSFFFDFSITRSLTQTELLPFRCFVCIPTVKRDTQQERDRNKREKLEEKERTTRRVNQHAHSGTFFHLCDYLPHFVWSMFSIAAPD